MGKMLFSICLAMTAVGCVGMEGDFGPRAPDSAETGTPVRTDPSSMKMSEFSSPCLSFSYPDDWHVEDYKGIQRSRCSTSPTKSSQPTVAVCESDAILGGDGIVTVYGPGRNLFEDDDAVGGAISVSVAGTRCGRLQDHFSAMVRAARSNTSSAGISLLSVDHKVQMSGTTALCIDWIHKGTSTSGDVQGIHCVADINGKVINISAGTSSAEKADSVLTGKSNHSAAVQATLRTMRIAP